jgi:putative membrane-bound dehydrogenase-like protein
LVEEPTSMCIVRELSYGILLATALIAVLADSALPAPPAGVPGDRGAFSADDSSSASPDDISPKPQSPEASRASIVVRDGFTVELMAAEPLVLDPVAFAFGADGRLWVAEMGDYPLGDDTPRPAGAAAESQTPPAKAGNRPIGCIRVLEDTDNDGRYDKSTVFLEIAYPSGVLPWKKGALITAAPHIVYAEDTDGDGRADTRETLYSGFVEGNQQHRVNGLARGLDNWIYVANGDSGGTIRYVGPDGKARGRDSNRPEIDISGRDLRIRPETGELEAVSGSTQFGRNRDAWGNWFGNNNSNPMYQFVLDDHYQRRNPHFASPKPAVDVPVEAGNAPVFPKSRLLARFNDYHTANRFTSACSAIIYTDDLFGPSFSGNAFISEPVHNLVHREVVSQRGPHFTSRRAPDEQQSEFLASSDNWFRPTMIQTGPDGALWIADMYRLVIEHPQWIPDTFQKKLDLRAGWDQGRLYRVYPTDRPPRPIPRLDRLDIPRLVAAFDSPSAWQRDTVQQLLIERGREAGEARAACVPLLAARVRDARNPLVRLHALCTLSGLAALDAAVVEQALADPHPGVRRHAIRVSEEVRARTDDMLLRLASLVEDEDPHVRLQLAWTLGEIDDPRMAWALGLLLMDVADDPYLTAAAMSSLNTRNIELILADILKFDRSKPSQLALLDAMLNQAAALGNSRAFNTLLTNVASPREGRFEPWQFAAIGSLLDTLDRRRTPLESLARSPDTDLQSALRNLANLFQFARDTVEDTKADTRTRVDAMRLLGRGLNHRADDEQRLAAFLSPRAAPELQEAAVAALGRLREARVAGLLLQGWRSYAPARRSQVFDVLLGREPWIDRVLASIEAGDISPTDIDAARRQRLLGHKSSAIRKRASELFAAPGGVDRLEIVSRYREVLLTPGQPDRGATIFARVCASCHKLQGVGHEVGPDLASLTDKSPEALLVAVLDPNRAVESKFQSYVAVTASGLTHGGIITAETGNSVTLRAPEGKEQTLLRAELDELSSTSKSAMPEGLEKDLSPADVADVIAYVRANVPLPVRRQFDGNSPELVRATPNGILRLTAANCEIYGSTLLFEARDSNLGYWSSLDDHAAWTVDVPAAGRYVVTFVWACDKSVAGNDWLLESAGGSLAGETGSTGNWETYREATVGEITLAAGRQRIALRPGEKPQGALIDLKSITLTPR